MKKKIYKPKDSNVKKMEMLFKKINNIKGVQKIKKI
tara:strand:- start:231 stop:338 length:108 start_codon:yes stop_codon:yes gene_type:complete